jgi:hypothetical protein
LSVSLKNKTINNKITEEVRRIIGGNLKLYIGFCVRGAPAPAVPSAVEVEEILVIGQSGPGVRRGNRRASQRHPRKWSLSKRLFSNFKW